MSPPRVALLVGEGGYGDVVEQVLVLLERAGAQVDWWRVEVPASGQASAEALLDGAVAAVEETGLALKTKFFAAGPATADELGTRAWNDPRLGNLNVLLRLRLDLYAGIRPLRPLAGLPTRHSDIDLVLIRENTEDIYKGIEHEIVDGVVQSIKVVTRDACRRISSFAFEYARAHRRRRVTFVHKANIMKRTDGLFLEVARAAAAEHPEIEYQETIVDAACMQLVLDPARFDVILTGNLYGDVLSSLGAGLAGGVSAAYGVNVGERARVYETIHVGAPRPEEAAHLNPLPFLMPAIALLRHLEQHEPAQRLEHGVASVLQAREQLTPDLGGAATTAAMCGAIGRA